jgi:uncharacterized membrane protein YdfJ with MMPL/SSD domain
LKEKTKNSWKTGTLKEYFEKILEEKDKALVAALIAVKDENKKTETAAEKRFELLNELRSGVATKEEVKALEKVVEDLKSSRDMGAGKDNGISKFLGWVIAILAVIAFIMQNLKLK